MSYEADVNSTFHQQNINKITMVQLPLLSRTGLTDFIKTKVGPRIPRPRPRSSPSTVQA